MAHLVQAPSVIIAAALILTNCKQPMKGTRMENASRSEQTVSDLRNAYAAFNRGDIDDALTPLDPQIEWSEPAEFPGGMILGWRMCIRFVTAKQSRCGPSAIGRRLSVG